MQISSAEIRSWNGQGPYLPAPPPDPDAGEGDYIPEPLTDEERAALRAILRRLGRNNRLRVLGEEILSRRGAIDDATVSDLQIRVMNLSGMRQNEVEAAVFLCSCIPLDRAQRAFFRDALIALLRLRAWKEIFGANALKVLLLTVPVALSISLLNIGLFGSLVMAMLVAVAALGPFFTVGEDAHLNRVKATALHALARFCLPNSCYLISEKMYDTLNGEMTVGSAQVRRAAAHWLPLPLARLDYEAHYGRLPTATVPNLCHALTLADEPLALDILQALEKIGDGRAVMTVERLTTRGKTPRIQAAAQRVFPILEQRQRDENAPRTLLRASAPVATPQNVLLRPAMNTAQEPPEELLRATNNTQG